MKTQQSPSRFFRFFGIIGIIALCLVLMGVRASSQSLSLFDVDASNFPTMKAKFFALDTAGGQITSLSPSDFEIKQNGQPRAVTYVSCPAPKPLQALSSVLVMDASGSMFGEGLDIAKAAAKAWIDILPPWR